MSENNSKDMSDIIEVYEDNFLKEIKMISSLIKEYNHIGISTEYPSMKYKLETMPKDYDYKTMKMNIDSTKMIQFGITLTNSKGEYPKDYHTWQFNFKFDKEEDKITQSSLNLLEQCGIDFTRLKNKGIPHKLFIQYFLVSGLVINPDVKWISFNGCYDFGYLIKLLISEVLPETKEEFLNLLNLYFCNYYDIKIMLKRIGDLQEGKNNLLQELEIIKNGKTHKAGKDSNTIIETFFKLKENGVLQEDIILNNKNCLFGLNEIK